MFVPCVLLGAGIGIADDRFGDMADLAGNAMIAVDLEASIPALPEEVHILTDDAHPVLFQLEQEEGHEGLLALRLRRSEEHTSELQSLMRISYAVFCLKKKIRQQTANKHITDSTHKHL